MLICCSKKGALQCGRGGIEVALTIVDTAIAARRAANLRVSQTAADLLGFAPPQNHLHRDTSQKEKKSGERHFSGEKYFI